MSNSPLATYTKISPNKNSPRNKPIDTITIHCTAGNKDNTARQIADYFSNASRGASCNYVVGGDGSVAISVEEKDRSWCTSSGANDNRAITIEVCSNIAGTEVNDKAYVALINLVADICRRNGIKKLVWSTNKNSRVNHLNGCNMTVHMDYANKACPGKWLYSRHGDIAAKVNALLGATTTTPTKPTQPTPTTMYRVRKTWANAKSQIGAYRDLNNAKVMADKNAGYFVFDNNGKVVYPVQSTAFKSYTVQVTADTLNIRKGPGTNYSTNGAIKDKGIYTIVEEAAGIGAKLWGKLKSGAGWISLDFTQKR